MSERLDIVDRLRSYNVGAHDGPPLHPTICDEAADEIERLRTLTAPQASWQPIETAPKDGTPILAANSRHEHAAVVVRWDSDDRDGAEPHWCDAATRDGIALYFNPNYFDLWMPAPAVTRPMSGGEK